MRKTLSIFGASFLIIIVWVLIDLGENSLIDFSFHIAVILATSVISLLIWGFKPTFEQYFGEKPLPQISVEVSHPPNPKYRHIEARLFFPQNLSQERRDPRQTKPRKKLILIKDLKKVYYVGSSAWNLIVTNQIEWFTDNEQDIEKWCKKEGYMLYKEDATEENLLEPYFYAGIKDKKDMYRPGEPILFHTHFRGTLVNGFFDNAIQLPRGKVFTNGKTMAWSWAPDTLDNSYFATKGKLNGYINHKSDWSWLIPQKAPIGEYKIFMRVYNHLDINTRPIINQEEDVINVGD